MRSASGSLMIASSSAFSGVSRATMSVFTAGLFLNASLRDDCFAAGAFVAGAFAEVSTLASVAGSLLAASAVSACGVSFGCASVDAVAICLGVSVGAIVCGVGAAAGVTV